MGKRGLPNSQSVRFPSWHSSYTRKHSCSLSQYPTKDTKFWCLTWERLLTSLTNVSKYASPTICLMATCWPLESIPLYTFPAITLNRFSSFQRIWISVSVLYLDFLDYFRIFEIVNTIFKRKTCDKYLCCFHCFASSKCYQGSTLLTLLAFVTSVHRLSLLVWFCVDLRNWKIINRYQKTHLKKLRDIHILPAMPWPI